MDLLRLLLLLMPLLLLLLLLLEAVVRLLIEHERIKLSLEHFHTR